MMAICYILGKKEKEWRVYIDDFIGLSKLLVEAKKAFEEAKTLLSELGVDRAIQKDMGPTTRIWWIGVIFDTEAMTISIPKDKLDDTLKIVREWEGKTYASRHMLQSLLGKLFHISKCCKPARLFLNRMLALLREAPQVGQIKISVDFKKDLAWFVHFLPSYNGVYIMEPNKQEHIIHINFSMNICGGCFCGKYFTALIPNFVGHLVHCNAHREMLSVVIATKLWAREWEGGKVLVNLREQHVIELLQSGRSRDPLLLSLAREVWMLLAKNSIDMMAIKYSEQTMGPQITATQVPLQMFKICEEL
jgi:hypothetical protein